jgi:hypothetical protein
VQSGFLSGLISPPRKLCRQVRPRDLQQTCGYTMIVWRAMRDIVGFAGAVGARGERCG